MRAALILILNNRVKESTWMEGSESSWRRSLFGLEQGLVRHLRPAGVVFLRRKRGFVLRIIPLVSVFSGMCNKFIWLMIEYATIFFL